MTQVDVRRTLLEMRADGPEITSHLAPDADNLAMPGLQIVLDVAVAVPGKQTESPELARDVVRGLDQLGARRRTAPHGVVRQRTDASGLVRARQRITSSS